MKKEGISRTYKGVDGYAPWLQIAQMKGISCQQREGKTEYVRFIMFSEKGFDRPLSQVFHMTEWTIDHDGQVLLIPEIEVSVYWMSLQCAHTEKSPAPAHSNRHSTSIQRIQVSMKKAGFFHRQFLSIVLVIVGGIS